MGGEIAIEVAHQANADADIVQVIAVDVAAGQLFDPSITDFDLAIPGGCAVADDKMVGQSVRHFAYVAVIIIKDPRISLSCPTVVDDDILPSIPGYVSIVNRLADGRSEVMPATTILAERCHLAFVAGFLDYDFIVVSLSEEKPAVSLFWLRGGSCNHGRRFLLGWRLGHFRLRG